MTGQLTVARRPAQTAGRETDGGQRPDNSGLAAPGQMELHNVVGGVVNISTTTPAVATVLSLDRVRRGCPSLVAAHGARPLPARSRRRAHPISDEHFVGSRQHAT